MNALKNLGRRKFFVTAGIAAAGLAVLNKLPFVKMGRFSAKTRIKVNLNPSAVKRTK